MPGVVMLEENACTKDPQRRYRSIVSAVRLCTNILY